MEVRESDPKRSPSSPKVIVVEDDPEIRDLEEFVLSAEGYDVVGVGSGEVAAHAVKHHGGDLVLLDLMLPGKDGNAVLEDLRSDPRTTDTPVIVVSAFVARLVRTPQVKQVIAKPFEIQQLLEAVRNHIG